MIDPSLVGTWTLAGVRRRSDELPFEGDDVAPGAAEAWLFGDADLPEGGVSEYAHRLEIRPDGTVSQSEPDPSLGLLDAEGVAGPGAGFDAVLHPAGGRAYLYPAAPPPPGQPGRGAAPRYDDGDLVVVEWVERVGAELVRVLATVADGLYARRLALRYRPAS